MNERDNSCDTVRFRCPVCGSSAGLVEVSDGPGETWYLCAPCPECGYSGVAIPHEDYDELAIVGNEDSADLSDSGLEFPCAFVSGGCRDGNETGRVTASQLWGNE